MSSTFPIVGIKAGQGTDGKVPIRRDVDEWWLSNDAVDINQKSLFLQAMSFFQQIDVEEKLSYFQIAGIHGQPLVPWDENTKPVTPGLGYCTHDSILFPSWHRPYLLLVEQRLYEIMIEEIIPKFAKGDQDELRKAADSWRLPYWDWASSKPDWSNPNDKSKYGPNAPKLVTEKTVEIRTPTGSSKIRNPFWDFQMPAVDGKRSNMGQYGITEVNDAPFQDCIATSKIPPTDDPNNAQFVADWVDGDVQNTQAIMQNLRKEAGVNALPEAVYRLFTTNYLSTYDAFASTRYTPIPPKFNPGQNIPHYLSLEGIHNNIHVDTGGLGHMAVVPVAAFDPIFWLHHCNVDRLYAIWQAVYPEKWFNPDPNIDSQRTDTGTWSNKEDTHGTYWNSDEARDWTKLGYSYTELQPWLPKYQVDGKFNEAAYQKDILTQIDRLYGTTSKTVLEFPSSEGSSAGSVQKPLQANPEAKPVPKTIHSVSHAHNSHTGAPHSTGHKIEAPDFVVNVLYEKFALGGNPFTVHLFLGQPPSHAPYTFAPGSNQIGHVYNFSVPSSLIGRDATEGCANCHAQEQARVKSTGQVVLTNALVAAVRGQHHHSGIHLANLDRHTVEACLKQNLHWRVTTRNRDVPLHEIPSLKVSVAMGSATHFSEDGLLSEYGGYEVLYAVTEGRQGGANPGDDI